MNRPESNSITELVKIVAREVVKEEVRQHERSQPHTSKSSAEDMIRQVTQERLDNVISSLQMAGSSWSKEEDALLCEEVAVALAQIAKNHNRSSLSIKCRIGDKDVLRR